jgi:glycosyltransferase involved in cell wall biosynthesis
VRIAFLHGSNDLYGASRVLAADCQLLSADEHDVDVVVPGPGPLTEMLRQAGASVVVSNRLRVLRRADPRSVIRMPTRLPPWKSKPDVVVIWTLALAHYIPVLAAHRIPTVVAVHELLPSTAGRALGALAAAARGPVLANSQAVAAWLRQCGVRDSRLEVAYPAAPPYEPLPVRAEDEQVRLLLAGRVNGLKGHLEAVEALDAVRFLTGVDVRLFLAGAPFPGQERHLDELLARLSGAPWATCLAETPDVRTLLADLDFMLCLPSRPESFGLTPVEAWAAGRRTLGSPIGGAAEVLRLVEGMALPEAGPRRVAALAECIQSPALRRPPPATAPVSHLATLDARTQTWHSVLAASC